MNSSKRKLQLCNDTMLQIEKNVMTKIVGGGFQEYCVCGCVPAQDNTCPGNPNPGYNAQCSCADD